MGSKRRSKIWAISADEMKALVARNTTYTAILDYFGLQARGHNFNTLKKRIVEDNIDDSHIQLNKLNYQGLSKPKDVSEVLINGSIQTSSQLKKRLFKLGMLEQKCSECGLGPEWNGKPISLQLDHIDGKHTNNIIENLRILCPNCHSQTETFGSKRLKKEKLTKPSGFGVRNEQRKVKWPSKEELEELIKTNSYTALGKMFGVSGVAVTRWAKGYGIYTKKKFRGVV